MAPRKTATKDETVKTNTENTATNAAGDTTAHVGDLVYDRAVLAKVAEGTNSEAGYAMIKATDSVKLIELDLITHNPAGPDADGNLQVALSPLGREAYAFNISDEGKAELATTTDGAKPKRTRKKSDIATPTNFTISTAAVPMPETTRSGRGNEIYPFRELDVGHSFHLPCENEEIQDLINSRVTSSISTANARYFDTVHPIGNVKGARFINRRVGEDDPGGRGVRVWRSENLTEDQRQKMLKEAAEAKSKADAEAAAKKIVDAGTAPAV